MSRIQLISPDRECGAQETDSHYYCNSPLTQSWVSFSSQYLFPHSFSSQYLAENVFFFFFAKPYVQNLNRSLTS